MSTNQSRKARPAADLRPTRARRRRPATTEQPHEPVLSFVQLIAATRAGLQTVSKRMQRVLGITAPQRLVLKVLGDKGPLVAADLARLLHFDRSTVSGIVARLSAAGFIHARRDAADGRLVRLSLTRRGKNALASALGTVEEAVQRILERTSQDDVETTRDVLIVLADELLELVERVSGPELG